MKRWLMLIYGAGCYLLAGLSVIYLAVFLNDADLPRSLNRGPITSPSTAALVDVLLLAIFGLQHSAMARQSFKRVWTRVVPLPIERSTYMLMSSLALVLICLLWRPLPRVIFDLRDTFIEWPIWFVAGLGCLIVLAAMFQFDHWEFLGVRQVWDSFRKRESNFTPFQVPELYRFCRHPMMAGILIVLWAVPLMTVGRLLFNAGFTLYILIAVRWEERDLIARFGDDYRQYRRQVRMLF